MQSVIEHFRSHAPANAAFYRLVGRTPRGEYTLFPRDNHSVYGLGEAPRGLLPGLYQVFYFDRAGQQIQHARIELSLTEAMASALGPVEGTDSYRSTSAAGAASLSAVQAQLTLPLPSAAVGSAHPELAREQAVHKMTLESDQQKHSFVQSSLYAREMGEALMLNRMMRQEMYELSNQSQLQVDKAHADVEKQIATLRLLRQARKEAMQDLNELPPPPPPPKPDYMPLANDLIGTISAIGKALIQSKSQAAAPRAEPVDSSQMLQKLVEQHLRSLEAERLPSPGTPSVPRADVAQAAQVGGSQVMQSPAGQPSRAVEQDLLTSPVKHSGPQGEAALASLVGNSPALQNPVEHQPPSIEGDRLTSRETRTSLKPVKEAERQLRSSTIDFDRLPERPESD